MKKVVLYIPHILKLSVRKKYYDKLYISKLYNLDKMEKLLERHKLHPTHVDIDNRNCS